MALILGLIKRLGHLSDKLWQIMMSEHIPNGMSFAGVIPIVIDVALQQGTDTLLAGFSIMKTGMPRHVIRAGALTN